MQPELATLKATGSLDVATLRTLPELEALRPEWAALWRHCKFATPFQTPDWLIPWARRWAADSLHVLAVRQAGTLIGLAPFFLYTQPPSSGRTLVLLGNGLSDTLDLLAAPGCEQAVAASVMATLEEQSDAWDACDWQQLRPGSPLLEELAPVSWKESIEPQDACPTLTLPAERPVETLLSPHFTRRLQADLFRLERLGKMCFEHATAENFDVHFDSLVQLHAARWSSRNEPGVLADPAVLAFHREAAAGLLTRGVLRFYRLLIDGCVAAVYYGFHHHQRSSYYLGGFDPALGSFGVGNQIVWHALRSAQREGACVFDFLRGRETYKYRWGAVDTPAFRRRLTHSQPREHP